MPLPTVGTVMDVAKQPKPRSDHRTPVAAVVSDRRSMPSAPLTPAPPARAGTSAGSALASEPRKAAVQSAPAVAGGAGTNRIAMPSPLATPQDHPVQPAPTAQNVSGINRISVQPAPVVPFPVAALQNPPAPEAAVTRGTNRRPSTTRSKEAERKARWRAANREKYNAYQCDLMRRRRVAERQEPLAAAAGA